MVKYSIIVPTCHKNLTDMFLENLSKINTPKEKYEVIIVHNATNEDLKSVVDKYVDRIPNLKYIYEENAGSTEARHTGVKISNGDFIKVLEYAKKQIADLEAKLSESEKQCQQCKHLNKKIELNIKNKLMSELAEKDKTITTLIEDSKTSKELLKKQLADKEQENERLKKEICKYEITLMDKNSQLKKQQQDKISFTIEQLEKAKELLLEKCGETYSKTYCGIDEDIEEIIGNQIKQLTH